ncbi:MAG: hypothetical protein FWC52_05785 [Candidatus Methanoplasma sp.]|nr:hypothetical protein [Candidatus Methanoplasma sp.]
MQPGQTKTYNGSGDSAFTINVDKSKFLRLMYNGSEVPAVNYTVAGGSGSTVITLKENYVNGFAPGTYHFTAVYTDGTSDLTLTVESSDSGVVGGSNALLWAAIIIVIIVIIAVIAFLLYRRSKA